MKKRRRSAWSFFAGLAFVLAAACVLVCDSYVRAVRAQETRGNSVLTEHAEAFASFEARVKEYVSMRERVEDTLPKLPTNATPEQIEAHKTAFQDAVRAERAGAKRGDLFT